MLNVVKKYKIAKKNDYRTFKITDEMLDAIMDALDEIETDLPNISNETSYKRSKAIFDQMYDKDDRSFYVGTMMWAQIEQIQETIKKQFKKMKK